MKKTLITIAFGFILASCSINVDPLSQYPPDYPPDRFRGDVTVSVMFTSRYAEECENYGLNPDQSIQACSIKGDRTYLIIVPNPCNSTGNYARILCHEIGHQNGWGRRHEQ